jgi:hypothetical protein
MSEFPRFIRQLAPTPGRVLERDPVTGKWPVPAHWHRMTHAEIDEGDRREYRKLTGGKLTREPGLREWELRKAVPWGEKPPSRTAYSDWVTASKPAIEEALEEKEGREAARDASVDAVQLLDEFELEEVA